MIEYSSFKDPSFEELKTYLEEINSRYSSKEDNSPYCIELSFSSGNPLQVVKTDSFGRVLNGFAYKGDAFYFTSTEDPSSEESYTIYLVSIILNTEFLSFPRLEGILQLKNVESYGENFSLAGEEGIYSLDLRESSEDTKLMRAYVSHTNSPIFYINSYSNNTIISSPKKDLNERDLGILKTIYSEL